MNHRNHCEYVVVFLYRRRTIRIHDPVHCLMYMMKKSSKVLFQFFLSNKMQEVEKFTFLKLYADTIKKLSESDERLAEQLCRKIVQYWIYWEYEETNPIVDALFIQSKAMIDKRRKFSIANAENWKKWWRPSKTKKTETKPKKKQNESESKANESKIENIKLKIENWKENEIILSNDSESKDSDAYWNADVNECLNLIKQFNWWLIDWTVKNNRRYAKLLIDKLNKLDSIKNWRFTRNATLELILQVISKNKYHASKITSPESIFRNLAILMQTCKNDVWKAQTNQTVLPTI